MLLQGQYDIVLNLSMSGIVADAIASELFKNSASTIASHLVGYQTTISGKRVFIEDFQESEQAITINQTSNMWRLRLNFIDQFDIDDFVVGFANALGLSPNSLRVYDVTPVNILEGGISIGLLIGLILVGMGAWVIFGD